MRAHLALKDLRELTPQTLGYIAIAIAKEIDRGADDKRAILETVFDVLRRKQ
jgi:hypothetical protein